VLGLWCALYIRLFYYVDQRYAQRIILVHHFAIVLLQISRYCVKVYILVYIYFTQSLSLSCSYHKGNTHLSLGKVKGDGDLISAQAREVVVHVELLLEFPDLVFSERRALLPRLHGQVKLERVICNKNVMLFLARLLFSHLF